MIRYRRKRLLLFVFVWSGRVFTGAVPMASAHTLQGGGTSANPYLISNKTDLLAMAANTNAYGSYFKMTADIDLAGEVFTSSVIAPAVNASGSPNWSLGTGARFTGSFDGNGHVIRNLTINDPTGLYVGLFGHIEAYGSYPGIVKNLGLENCNISGALISGRGVVGGICGNNFYGHIENCYVTGQVSGQGYVGGICGDNYGGTVSNCFSLCSVSAFWRGGGLCGRNYQGQIENCYAAGPVSGGSEIGGLTGNNNYGGTVSTTRNSFWDMQVSGRTTSAGGIGKTTAQMKTQSTFLDAGWDFSAYGPWRRSRSTGSFGGYPVLKFQPEANQIPDRPLPVSPASAARGRSLTLTLQGSAFFDPDGDAHANSWWQVDDSYNFSSPEWDSGDNWVAGTQVAVPGGLLAYSTRYYWRMCYKDSQGSWSEWSYSRTFTTESRVQVTNPESGGSITPFGDVSAGQSCSVTLNAVPDPGHKLIHWLVDGEIAAVSETTLTLENITADMTVEAVFEKIKAMPWLNLLLE